MIKFKRILSLFFLLHFLLKCGIIIVLFILQFGAASTGAMTITEVRYDLL